MAGIRAPGAAKGSFGPIRELRDASSWYQRGDVPTVWSLAGEEDVMNDVPGHSRVERRLVLRHSLEMVGAMIAGMVVLGALVSLFCSLSGHSSLLQHPGAGAPVMVTDMTVGMSLWMRYRGHSWAATGEMATAMYAPLAILLVPFWTGALSGGALLGISHVLMLPAMVVAMLHRRGEYTRDHRRPAPLASAAAR